MVANGTAYATLINEIEAAKYQEKIQNKRLRIVRSIEKPFPYLVFIYTKDKKQEEVKRLRKCLDELPPTFLEMVSRFNVPPIQYTNIEINEPKDLFTTSPYLGTITICFIVVLVVAGFTTDYWPRCRKEKTDEKLTMDKKQANVGEYVKYIEK